MTIELSIADKESGDILDSVGVSKAEYAQFIMRCLHSTEPRMTDSVIEALEGWDKPSVILALASQQVTRLLLDFQSHAKKELGI